MTRKLSYMYNYICISTQSPRDANKTRSRMFSHADRRLIQNKMQTQINCGCKNVRIKVKCAKSYVEEFRVLKYQIMITPLKCVWRNYFNDGRLLSHCSQFIFDKEKVSCTGVQLFGLQCPTRDSLSKLNIKHINRYIYLQMRFCFQKLHTVKVHWQNQCEFVFV